MSFREVIIHTNGGIFFAPPGSVQSQPPVVDYRLAEDLEIKRLDHAVTNKVMELCEPNWYGVDRPTRQFAQLYAFVRSGSPSERIWGQPDNRLYMCIALSRLVHPTSVGFIYHAQLNFGPNGELTQCIPISLEGHPTGAWIADREGRDWLTDGDAAELEAFLARDLRYRAVGAKVTSHDADVARALDWIRNWMDDFLTGGQVRQIGQVLRDRLAGDREAITVQQFLIKQQLHHPRRAADGM